MNETPNPPEKRIHLSVQEAWQLAKTTLLRIGYTEENATLVSDHLIAAALCGY